jgi:hypothetical protein
MQQLEYFLKGMAFALALVLALLALGLYLRSA